MARMKDQVIMLAEEYRKTHPEASWEEAMDHVCGRSDIDEKAD